ncbi:MAG: Fe-S cluster assembly protein SufD [Acidobacteria bacterium]|nr:Fe-S cluster assembly protein SufD [Acidobacteriota bacterium]
MTHVAERATPVSAHVARYITEYQDTRAPSQPRWLVKARESALTSFERLGFPTTKLEQWRFTSVTPITEKVFALASDGVAGADKRVTSSLGGGAAVAVCLNGRFAPTLSTLDRLPKGIQVTGIEAALSSNPALLQPYLARLAPSDTQAFTSLNTAFLRDGVFIFIAPHAVIETPIEVVFASVAVGRPTVSHPRLLIVAGEASQGQVLERYVGSGATFSNAVTEVWLGANAVVDHYKVQEEPAEAFHVGSMYLHAARSSNFSSHSITFGGALVRNDVVAVLDGEGIDCTLNGLYVGRGRQFIDNHTTIDHAQPHCGSHEVYKGILADQSRAVFNGKIVVRPDAQKTDAKQTNKALLLSDDAQINTKPELEIFANDVKCTHGAAIGQLDDDAVFYLRSRGLGYDEARALLIHAFAGDILNRIKIAPLREHLEAALTARLPQTE